MRLPFLYVGVVAFLAGTITVAQAPADPRGAAVAHPKAAPSTALVVTAAGKTASFSLADLQGMAQKTVKVHNAHRDAEETYVGVLLTEVLAKAGAGDAGVGKPLLRSYVKAEGTDRYWVLYSGIEIEGVSHVGDVIVATSLDGKGLGENGPFMLVSTEDKKPQRWVRNLSGVTLVAVP